MVSTSPGSLLFRGVGVFIQPLTSVTLPSPPQQTQSPRPCCFQPICCFDLTAQAAGKIHLLDGKSRQALDGVWGALAARPVEYVQCGGIRNCPQSPSLISLPLLTLLSRATRALGGWFETAAHLAASMPSSRLSARLGQLPHDVLAELAARLCSNSPALQAAAEECMAAHTPLPHEMVERVLLSPDLVPHILGPLVVEDGAAAAVCSQWLVGWKATNEPRRWLKRRLKPVPLDFPEEIDTRSLLQMTATPDGHLVLSADSEVRILDRSMRVLQTVTGEFPGSFAASDDSIFTLVGDSLCRSTYDGTTVAEYQLEGHHFNYVEVHPFAYGVLAPGGLLFCVMFEEAGDPSTDEIIALDAQTLQLRHRFGLGLLKEVGQLAVGGDELYVCDTGNHRLQVFSLTGEHRRSVRPPLTGDVGRWMSPTNICFAEDRLYLVEEGRQGCRVLVLSLQGDILQVVTHPTEPSAKFKSICCFDNKLLASYLAGSVRSGSRAYGMLALQESL